MSFILAEGTYTSYAIYDSFNDADVYYAYAVAAWVNCLETKAILITRYSENYLKVYDIDTKTVGSTTELANSDFGVITSIGWVFKQTFLNTYVAVVESVTNNLLIYKNGELLQTLTPTDLGFTAAGPKSISFSQRGKYIFLAGILSASGNSGWVVLKGT